MQSGCKGEGKAAGTAYRRQKLCGENRDTMPVKNQCGNGFRQTALAGSKEGSIFAIPFLPLTGMGGYLPGGDSFLGDLLSLFHSSRRYGSSSGVDIPALSLMQV